MSSLDLALIGNGTLGILLDASGDMVWGCFPRFDGDPLFCTLLRERDGENDFGYFAVELTDCVRQEQEYLVNTPVVVTRLFDAAGGCVEVTDFAPRFLQFQRVFCPMMVVRKIQRVSGTPRVRIRLRPARDYGAARAVASAGSNHIRFLGGEPVLRLTTDASITGLLEEQAFFLDRSITLLLGPDETIPGNVSEMGERFLAETIAYWRDWVRSLAIPFEWQDAVIRAAITLKLNVFEDTGAIIAAMTTSIPEAPNSGRNWDYRHCWLRDGYFVVDALNRLGVTRTMERYLGYVINVAAGAPEGRLQPVYSLSGRQVTEEHIVTSLPGYRGMGPVRVGNQAHRQIQHDVYGSAILAATHVFFDQRLVHGGGDLTLFMRLESLGLQAAALFDQPDAGIWELRGSIRVHTYSSVMCWAACDRLARIAARLGLGNRAEYWRTESDRIHEFISARAWNPELGSFVGTMNGTELDASLLLLNDLGFLKADDPRFIGTVRAVQRCLVRGDCIYRYVEKDDFGVPENAFLVCTLWFVNALAAIGDRDDARALFEKVLALRNRHGLLSEDVDIATGELWGNFVQTYSMVGLISAAVRLSLPWDEAF
jgi:GH15 family glucan-1,4-alpha-glucosidase